MNLVIPTLVGLLALSMVWATLQGSAESLESLEVSMLVSEVLRLKEEKDALQVLLPRLLIGC